MWIKILVLIFLSLTEVFGTPIYNKAAKLTLDDCWQIRDYVTYWKTSFAIAVTILTTILLGGIICFVLYCRSKRNR
jgi:riboflavin transporter FmnP